MQPTLVIYEDNSRARIVCQVPGILDLLRFDLSYLSSTGYIPGTGCFNDGWVWLLRDDGSLPAGLVPRARRLLDKYGIEHKLVDGRNRPDDEIPLWSGIREMLRPFQRQLVERALEEGRGILDSPPRSGKTFMGAAIVDAQPHPTLWIAPTKGIVRQTVNVLKRLLPFGPDGVVELTGGWPKGGGDAAQDRRETLHSARVVVTTAATAVKAPPSFYASRKRLVIDEFHHAAASTYHEINDLARDVYFRIGMTGTHFRSDEQTEILMDAVLADVIGRVSIQQLVDMGHLTPADVVFVPIEEPKLGPSNLDFAYRLGVLNHARRNEWAAWAARALMACGRRVLVLVKLIEHGERLASMIPGSVFVRGADGKAMTDDDVAGAIAEFNAGRVQCLVGTSVLGEGIDLPAADALVYAKGGSAAVTITQDIFRVLTAAEGKAPRSIIVDFADRHHDGLLGQTMARGRVYADEPCFEVDVLPAAHDLEGWIRRHARPPALI